MQTQNRLFDDLARVAGGALGAFSGLREEIELLVRGRIERVLTDMELVPRDEFEAVKAMAAEARAENERLAARLAEVEGALAAGKAPSKGKASAKAAAGRRPRARRAATKAAAKTTPRTPPEPEPQE
jgi:BMFP domain-containing protein YqiC